MQFIDLLTTVSNWAFQVVPFRSFYWSRKFNQDLLVEVSVAKVFLGQMHSTQAVTLFMFPFVPWDPECLLKASGVTHRLNHFEFLKLLKCAWISNTYLSVNEISVECRVNFPLILSECSPVLSRGGKPALGILEVCCPSLEFDRVSRVWLSAQTSLASPLSILDACCSNPCGASRVLHLCQSWGTGILGRVQSSGTSHPVILDMPWSHHLW